MIRFYINFAEPLHSPDGKKRGGADAASLGGALVMQVRCKNWILDILEKCVTLSYHEHTNYQIARRVEGRSSKIQSGAEQTC
jgi:hypothetical protein